jgi:tetratricopeptide (TPR) repeat protein
MTPDRQDAQTWIERGKALSALGRFAEAIPSFDQALALDATYAAAWASKADALAGLERWPEALASYNRAVALNPEDATTRRRRGVALERLGLYDQAAAVFASLQHWPEALASYNRAVALNPQLASTWQARGFTLHALGLHEQALASFDRALALDANAAAAWAGKGNVLGRLGQWRDALECCDRALMLNPQDAGAWTNKGVALVMLGERHDALACLEQARRLGGTREVTADLECAAQWLQGRGEDASAQAIRGLLVTETRAGALAAEPPRSVQSANAQPATAAPPHRSGHSANGRHATGSDAPPPLPPDAPPGVHRELRIFIDTCSLMFPQAEQFFERWVRPLGEQPTVLVLLPTRVHGEVQKHLAATDPQRRQHAEAADRLLRQYWGEPWFRVAGEPDDAFADNVFLALFTKYRLHYDLCLVTQDHNLASDILGLRHSRSVRTHKHISAYYIDQHGNAQDWQRPATRARYTLHAGPVQLDTTLLPPCGPLQAGMDVYTVQRRPIRLVRQLGKPGGEGTVFLTDSNLACKIYNVSRPTVTTREKLALMCSKRLVVRGICWPQELVFDTEQRFAGYTMPLAEGIVLDDLLVTEEAPPPGPKLLRLVAFPSWDRIALTTLVITMLEVVSRLHEANILLGDINPKNFLVKDERTVYLVDTDSYQVETYPCPVYMPPFLHPELVGKDLRSLLRTMKHEHFAVATLIFRTLMLGVSPYAHKGGGTPEENLLKQKFPYPGRNKDGSRRAGQGVPDGGYGYIWSWMPAYVKEAFQCVFAEHEEVPAQQWLDHLKRYRAYLRRPDVDAHVLMLVPNGYRKLRGGDGQDVQHRVCAHCKAEYDVMLQDRNTVNLCPDCKVLQTSLRCEIPDCNREETVKMIEYYLKWQQRGFRCREHGRFRPPPRS